MNAVRGDAHPFTMRAGDPSPNAGSEPERAVRTNVERGDLRRATTIALRLYGAEVFGFLAGVLDDANDAREVFSQFSERVWRGIARFQWHCSLRTWCYAIARNELARFRGRAGRHAARHAPLSDAGAVPAEARATTRTCERTTVRDAFHRLRSGLPPEDQDLLVLRVDRQLPWRDLALAFLDDGAAEADVVREAARLRKRFQLVKDRLIEAAVKDGLMPRRT